MSQRLLHLSTDATSFDSSRSWARFEALLLRRDVPGFARREAAAQEDFERAAVLCEAAQEESSEGFSSIREDLSISDDDDELYSD